MTYGIMYENLKSQQQPQPRNNEDLQPIIDPRQNSRALNDAASILKDCGLDNVCIPDLKIAHHMSIAKVSLFPDVFLSWPLALSMWICSNFQINGASGQTLKPSDPRFLKQY